MITNRKKRINSNGYVLIFTPDHAVAQRSGWAFEHRLVWHDANGSIPDGWVIHHINGVKDDNKLENLSCMNRAQHAIEHANQTQPILEKFREIGFAALQSHIFTNGAWNKGTKSFTHVECKACGATFQKQTCELARCQRRGFANCCSKSCRSTLANRARATGKESA